MINFYKHKGKDNLVFISDGNSQLSFGYGNVSKFCGFHHDWFGYYGGDVGEVIKEENLYIKDCYYINGTVKDIIGKFSQSIYKVANILNGIPFHNKFIAILGYKVNRTSPPGAFTTLGYHISFQLHFIIEGFDKIIRLNNFGGIYNTDSLHFGLNTGTLSNSLIEGIKIKKGLKLKRKNRNVRNHIK